MTGIRGPEFAPAWASSDGRADDVIGHLIRSRPKRPSRSTICSTRQNFQRLHQTKEFKQFLTYTSPLPSCLETFPRRSAHLLREQSVRNSPRGGREGLRRQSWSILAREFNRTKAIRTSRSKTAPTRKAAKVLGTFRIEETEAGRGQEAFSGLSRTRTGPRIIASPR